jgi:hypothetical protein
VHHHLSVFELPRTTSRGATADDLTADRFDVQAVRAWARSRGYPIDESGSIPLAVLRTYRRLHPC